MGPAPTSPVLYCGDGTRAGAASYLCAVLARAGIPFDHVASAEPLPQAALDGRRTAFVLSDYPARNLTPAQAERLCALVAGGAGLLTIGGWASYVGRGGDWHESPLARILPVRLAGSDDRRNTARPCVVVPGPAHPHPITAGLPLDGDLPTIAGFNAVEALPGAEVALEVAVHAARPGGAGISFAEVERRPLLVLGAHGAGRIACWAGDVAPHWVGGLADWGEPRIAAQAEGSAPVEIGRWYAELFARLVRWSRGDGA